MASGSLCKVPMTLTRAPAPALRSPQRPPPWDMSSPRLSGTTSLHSPDAPASQLVSASIQGNVIGPHSSPPSTLIEKKNVSQWWLLFSLFSLRLFTLVHTCSIYAHTLSNTFTPLAYIADIPTHLVTSAQSEMHIIMNIPHRQLCEWVDKWKGTWLSESAWTNLNDKDKLGENDGWTGSEVLRKQWCNARIIEILVQRKQC